MGSWFSNLHIRKNATITEASVAEYVQKLMSARQFMPAASEAEADGAVAIVAGDDCQWISVYSDLLSLEDPGECTEIATRLSSELQTDILGISLHRRL